jgi:hypothetical protein
VSEVTAVSAIPATRRRARNDDVDKMGPPGAGLAGATPGFSWWSPLPQED